MAASGERMRLFSSLSSAVCVLFFVAVANSSVTAANVEAQLNGAWAESDENCKSAFVANGGRWNFREPRDMYGSSYIISGRRYEGPFGVCNLTSIQPKGDQILLALSCHNSIGYSNQVTPIHLTSDTEMVVFSMNGMSINYKKCAR
jgi:hypothetical protein